MNIDLRHDIWLYDKEYIVNYKFFDSFIFSIENYWLTLVLHTALWFYAGRSAMGGLEEVFNL